MPKIKKSYGIVCYRPSRQGIQLLMIKKSTTYHFCEFVAGHYRKFNEAHIMKLLNNMTYYEKMDILSLNFQNMWYRIYLENPDKVFLQNSHNTWANLYFRKKNKFEFTFLRDGGKKLRQLIANSRNVDTLWEFPKGRKNDINESDVETAIREFREETGIDYSKYQILWHIKPFVETYTDFGITYQNTYFYAKAIGEWDAIYNFYDKYQISEVSDIKWITKNNLKFLNLDPKSYKRLYNRFLKIIKKCKKI